MTTPIWFLQLVGVGGALWATTGAAIFFYRRLWTKASAFTLSAIAFAALSRNDVGAALFGSALIILGFPTILLVLAAGRLLSRDVPVAQADVADPRTSVPDGDRTSPTCSIDQDSCPTETQLGQLPQTPKAIDGQKPVVHEKKH